MLCYAVPVHLPSIRNNIKVLSHTVGYCQVCIIYVMMYTCIYSFSNDSVSLGARMCQHDIFKFISLPLSHVVLISRLTMSVNMINEKNKCNKSLLQVPLCQDWADAVYK